MMTKLKLREKSQKIKWDKTQMVTKLENLKYEKNIKNSNYDKSYKKKTEIGT